MRSVNRRTVPPKIGEENLLSSGQAPLYVLVANILRRAIQNGAIPQGAVILEGPLAELLQCTRAPVRQSLLELARERLISRFDGRGYVVGPVGVFPRRVKITASMLDVGATSISVRKSLGWEGIQERLEREVVHASLFGQQRVNEVELARYCGVGRAVARDALLRLENLGLVEKDQRLRWTIIPLDGVRINHLYELRWLLEPAALHGAAATISQSELHAMSEKLRHSIDAYPRVAPADLDRLETDLHVSLLSHCPNQELVSGLQRTRCVLTLSKHVLGASAPMPHSDPFMAEHLDVLTALEHGNVNRATEFLRTHLEMSCLKVIGRADLVRSTFEKPALPYLGDG